MDDDATVSAADIARLAGVGRAAVSNWRRRYPDFPQPVGGTASSPLFGLSAVAGWFRARGKKFELSAGERAWQRLRALGDDLDLPGRVSRAGAAIADRATSTGIARTRRCPRATNPPASAGNRASPKARLSLRPKARRPTMPRLT